MVLRCPAAEQQPCSAGPSRAACWAYRIGGALPQERAIRARLAPTAISAGSGTPAARAVKPPDQDADALLVEVRAEHPAVIGVDAVAVTSRASSRTDTVPSPPSQGCAACGRDRARCSCSQLVADLHGRPASDDVVHTAVRPWRQGAIGSRGQCWSR
jgi:hypothetical protein